MILDSRVPVPGTKVPPAGVVYDHGRACRVPFVIWFDSEGNYEQHIPAPNGVDVICEPGTHRPYVRRGKAVGRLELLPFGKAELLGPNVEPPKRVEQTVQPLTKDEKVAGMQEYQKLFSTVWRWRGESDKAVNQRWLDYLRDSEFLGEFVLKRRSYPTR